MERRLKDKIEQLDISQPYVWRLRLSETDFTALEAELNVVARSQDCQALASEENAKATVVYMAEWYKRRYQRGNKCDLVDGLDLETLWTNAGISKKRYLYRDDNGNKRWLYSIYVLGGLAIKHELGRNDNMKFLKGLCRIYHGENYTLENLDDAARAVAFRESIKRQHSLYEYMKEILNGELPFDAADLKDETSDVNRFVATIKAANDEILRQKFRLEWAVTFSPDYGSMTRRLNIWLKPEEVGGGLHQYLRYDRVHLWGVPHPENQQHLFIYIRFKDGDKVVGQSLDERPLITYLNHGVNDFVAFGVEKGVQIKHIPTCRFTRIEIIVKDDEGNEYLAQTLDTTEWLQLWRQGGYGDTWTSTRNDQKETALLFSNRCRLKDAAMVDTVSRKPFRDQKTGVSETWNWMYIYDSVTFLDEHGREISLYNRNGYDQVTTRLYTDTIRYVSGGKVKHRYLDDPDISDEYSEDELPVIFGQKDIIVRHFLTKDDIRNARPESDIKAEQIEYKTESGRYKEWTSIDEPTYGEVTLRVTIKGKPYLLTVAYLPGLNIEQPIRRDYEHTLVCYRGLDKQELEKQDEIPMDGQMLNPTITIQYGEDSDHYIIEVYRPTLIKEVLLDGEIIQYLRGDEMLHLPYIFKKRVILNDFSEQGYQSYDCKNLGSIYRKDLIDIEHNPSVGMAALAAWDADCNYAGKLLDAMAPDSLTVCFGRAKDDAIWEGQDALLWDYDCEKEPMATCPDAIPEFGIIFQNLSNDKNLVCNFPILQDDDPWGFDDVDCSIVKCFEVANKTETYFFLMKPLRDMRQDEIIPELYRPLLCKREGKLTDKDKEGLVRLGEEFGFDWQAHKISFDNEND